MEEVASDHVGVYVLEPRIDIPDTLLLLWFCTYIYVVAMHKYKRP